MARYIDIVFISICYIYFFTVFMIAAVANCLRMVGWEVGEAINQAFFFALLLLVAEKPVIGPKIAG